MRVAPVRVLLAMLSLASAVEVARTEPLPDGVDAQTGYRLTNYRAPTPDFLPGGMVFDFARVAAAVDDKSHILIDVYADGIARDPIDGAWVVAKPHQSIPGAVWLPGVGAGRLDAEADAYFRMSLERLTGHDKRRDILIFCLADCWHSWNAARRAVRYGYTGVAWYPLGTDGWTGNGRALSAVEPLADAD